VTRQRVGDRRSTGAGAGAGLRLQLESVSVGMEVALGLDRDSFVYNSHIVWPPVTKCPRMSYI